MRGACRLICVDGLPVEPQPGMNDNVNQNVAMEAPQIDGAITGMPAPNETIISRGMEVQDNAGLRACENHRKEKRGSGGVKLSYAGMIVQR